MSEKYKPCFCGGEVRNRGTLTSPGGTVWLNLECQKCYATIHVIEEYWEDRSIPLTEYWLEHYMDKEKGMCTLCGQSGIIHTEGIRTPGGIEVGRANYCICPNGQSLRTNSR